METDPGIGLGTRSRNLLSPPTSQAQAHRTFTTISPAPSEASWPAPTPAARRSRHPAIPRHVRIFLEYPRRCEGPPGVRGQARAAAQRRRGGLDQGARSLREERVQDRGDDLRGVCRGASPPLCVGGRVLTHGAQSIESMLRNQPGIHSVKVALLAERAVVEYDPQVWTVDKIASVSATIRHQNNVPRRTARCGNCALPAAAFLPPTSLHSWTAYQAQTWTQAVLTCPMRAAQVLRATGGLLVLA